MSWRWISLSLPEIIHLRQVATHGGRIGVRDAALLDSALHRPLQKAHYSSPSINDLAAAYAFGIIQNHPFYDGNKRVGLIIMVTFLRMNGHDLHADDADLVGTIEAVAASRMSEDELARWTLSHLTEPA